MVNPSLGRHGLPSAVLDLCQRLADAGHHAWLVGGSVRDSLLWQLRGQAAPGMWHAKDWDIATNATPDEVTRIFRRVIPTGIEHGTVTVILQGTQLEVTTLRAERGYADGRRPDQIDFVRSIDEDLARRDFTINAIAFDPRAELLIDPFGGLDDLRGGCVRAVGDPARRFSEDGLRVLRAARFVASLEFNLAPTTAQAITPSLDTYRRVSAERIREEWNKTLIARLPSRGFAVMHEHGLLAVTAPEIAALSQRSISDQNGLSLALRRVDLCPTRPELRLAALLADLHEDAASAADAADAFLSRLRYSNLERKWITRLVRHRALPFTEALTDAELRRWLRRVGPDLVDDLYDIESASLSAGSDAGAELSSADDKTHPKLDALAQFKQRAAAELALEPPLSLSDLAIDGKQLMAEAGFRPGREIGSALETLLERVIEDPTLNTTAQLVEQARALKR